MSRFELKFGFVRCHCLGIGILLAAAQAPSAPALAQCRPFEDRLLTQPGYSYWGGLDIDGTTYVVSATTPSAQGAAIVLVEENGEYVEQAQLTASDAGNDWAFGGSIAIDGDTIVVGACTAGDNDAGAAYVYTRSDGVWTERVKLVASDAGDGDYFGYDVAISGSYIVVGTPRIFSSTSDAAGAAYVFELQGDAWVEVAKLTAADSDPNDIWGNKYGCSVSIDGDTIAVGASSDDPRGESSAGSVYVYVESASGWIQQAKLIASDAQSSDNLGESVAMEGNTIIAGAPGDTTTQAWWGGSAYIFSRSVNNVWSQQAKVIGADILGSDDFGCAVALSGNFALVGAHRFLGYNDPPGSAYVFVRSGAAWRQIHQISASNATSGDMFGNDVAMSGNRVAVNAIREYETFLIDLGCCTGDADGSGWVDMADLATLLANFGRQGNATPNQGDLNYDRSVNLADLSLLLPRFGGECP